MTSGGRTRSRAVKDAESSLRAARTELAWAQASLERHMQKVGRCQAWVQKAEADLAALNAPARVTTGGDAE